MPTPPKSSPRRVGSRNLGGTKPVRAGDASANARGEHEPTSFSRRCKQELRSVDPYTKAQAVRKLTRARRAKLRPAKLRRGGRERAAAAPLVRA